MVQGESVMRNEGMLGFDWAIHKGNTEAADSDLISRSSPPTSRTSCATASTGGGAVGLGQERRPAGATTAAIAAAGEVAAAGRWPVPRTPWPATSSPRPASTGSTACAQLLGDLVAPAPATGDREAHRRLRRRQHPARRRRQRPIEGRGGNDVIDGDALAERAHPHQRRRQAPTAPTA